MCFAFLPTRLFKPVWRCGNSVNYSLITTMFFWFGRFRCYATIMFNINRMNDWAVPGNFSWANLNPGGSASCQCSWSHIYKGLLAAEMRSIKGPITNLLLKSSWLYMEYEGFACLAPHYPLYITVCKYYWCKPSEHVAITLQFMFVIKAPVCWIIRNVCTFWFHVVP